MDPSVFSLPTQALEQAINTALRYDPGSQAQLVAFSGRRVAVYAEDFRLLTTVLLLEDGRVALTLQQEAQEDTSEDPADVRLEGRSPQLMSLLLRSRKSLADSGVKASGDLSLLESLLHVFQQLDIDWETAVAKHTGPVLAQALGSGVRTAVKGAHGALRQLEQQGQHFLIDELQLLPIGAELRARKDAIHSLRERTDRLQAKLAQLEAQAADGMRQ